MTDRGISVRIQISKRDDLSPITGSGWQSRRTLGEVDAMGIMQQLGLVPPPSGD